MEASGSGCSSLEASGKVPPEASVLRFTVRTLEASVEGSAAKLPPWKRPFISAEDSSIEASTGTVEASRHRVKVVEVQYNPSKLLEANGSERTVPRRLAWKLLLLLFMALPRKLPLTGNFHGSFHLS